MAWGVWGGSPPPTGKSKVYLKPFIPAITSYIRLYPAISGYIQLRPRSSLSSLLSVHIAKDALMALYLGHTNTGGSKNSDLTIRPRA